MALFYHKSALHGAPDCVTDKGPHSADSARFECANDIVYRPHIVSAVPGNVTGDDIVRARAKPHTGLGDYVIEFELSSDGGKKFHKLTSENRNRNLAIILDGTLISAPVINCAISTEGMIVGDFTKAEADRLADSLNSGSLPASLKILSQTCDTPTISKKASGAKATRP